MPKVEVLGKIWNYEIGGDMTALTLPRPNHNKRINVSNQTLTGDKVSKPNLEQIKTYIEKNLSKPVQKIEARQTRRKK